MKDGFKKLKRQFDENPTAVIGVLSAAVYSTAKVIDAVSAAQGRHAYAKQVKHSVKRNKNK